MVPSLTMDCCVEYIDVIHIASITFRNYYNITAKKSELKEKEFYFHKNLLLKPVFIKKRCIRNEYDSWNKGVIRPGHNRFGTATAADHEAAETKKPAPAYSPIRAC